MLLADAREAFLTAAKSRNLSPRTVTWYGMVVGQLAEHVGADKDVATVTAADVRAFLAARLEGHSPRSVANYRTGLRVFFRWLVAEEHIDRDPTLRVKGPRVPRHVPVVLAAEEVSTLLRAWPGSGYAAHRNRVAVLMLLDTGLRVAELCSLTIGAVDLVAATATVMGKGRKERQVPLSMPLRSELRRFLRVREAARLPSTFLFASSRGGRWATNSVERAFRKAAMATGLDPARMRPHNFRRTAATTLLRQGASLEHVRAILGHSDVSTTARYLGLDVGDLKAVHAAASPLVAFGLAATPTRRSR
ncbi:MAG: tyrosine-type recombinase/integrase [Firmicutes bacterium]|nr:tyrosine-type recombinase/integrase [Bacillota bacterium]